MERRIPEWTLDRGRRVAILDAGTNAVDLLASPRRVAIIMPVDAYEKREDRFDAVAHRAVRAPRGMDLFVLVCNP